jgi:hypothetical protein
MPFIDQPINLGPEVAHIRTVESSTEFKPDKISVEDESLAPNAFAAEFISPKQCVNSVFKNLSGSVGMTSLMPIYNKNGRAKITILSSDPGDIPGCGDIIRDVKSVASANLGQHGGYRVVSRAVYSYYSGLNNHKNFVFPTRMANGIFGLKDTVTVSYRTGSDGKVVSKSKTYAGNATAE